MDTVSPPNFPSYPIRIEVLKEDGGDTWLKCCCGHVFFASPATEENTVTIHNQITAACPNCYGTDGMVKVDHALGLAAINGHLNTVAPIFLRGQHHSVRAFFYSTVRRLSELLAHAKLEWVRPAASAGEGLSIQISEPLRPRASFMRLAGATDDFVDQQPMLMAAPAKYGMGGDPKSPFSFATPDEEALWKALADGPDGRAPRNPKE